MGRWLDMEEQERRFPMIPRLNPQKDHNGRHYIMVNLLWQGEDEKIDLHCAPLKGKLEDVVKKIQSEREQNG